MLIRNILISRGLANGAQFIVLSVGRHFVETVNVNPGEFFGNIEFFFRIRVCTSLEFPLRVLNQPDEDLIPPLE